MSIEIQKIMSKAYDQYTLSQMPLEIEPFLKFIKSIKAKNILEVGTLFGGMFYSISKASGYEGFKISVDWPDAYGFRADERYKKLVNESSTFGEKVHLIDGDSHSQETYNKLKTILNGEELDFIFIDGDHSYEGVKQDFEMYKDFLKDGGWIGFHDINDTEYHRSANCYVVKLWNELIKEHDNYIEFNTHSFAMGIGVVQVFKNKKKLDLSLSFESPGKINILNNSHTNLDLILSIKDKHTDIPIYYCNIHFSSPGTMWYIIPIGDTNWLEEKYLNTFKLEFYDKDKNLLDVKELKIKEDRIELPNIGTRHFSPFECLWINYKQMFLEKIYDKFEMDNLECVIDIGANVGIFSNYIATRGAKNIHAIEPTQKAFEQLQSQFFYYQRVFCHKIGIGAKNENKIIYTNNENSTISSFLTKTSDDITEENIEILNLNSFYQRCGLQKIDLIKMDIEAMEYEVFDSITDSDINKCEKYLIEYHLNQTGNADRLIERFKKIGYDVQVYPDVDSNIQGHFFAKKKVNYDSKQPIFPKRAFVTFTNDYYLPIVEKLVNSISNNSSYPIIVYGINCDINFSYPNLYSKRLDIDSVNIPKFITDNKYTTRKYGNYEIEHKMPSDFMGIVDRNDIGTYMTLSRKPIVILDALNNGLEEGIFLDADGLVKENIDTAFDYLKECENYPLVGKGLFEYMLLNGIGNPHTGDCLEKPLMDLLGVTNRTMHYVSTNFILFTNKMKPFIQEWKNIADNKSILENNVRYAPYHDETIINVLLWKWGANKHLPVVHYNLTNCDKAKEFYETDKRDYHTDSEWHYIPSDIDDIKYFHGCKSIEELEKTISLIENKKNKLNFCFEKLSFSKNPKIAILTLFDSNYTDLGKIALPNRIEYAKTHGYDCIYFTDTIDNSRPPQWSKVKAVEYFLDEYDWIWWLDIDALIMDKNKKLESIIDENYDIIFTENKYSLISNGSSFFRNTELTKKFLKECYSLKNPLLKDIDVSTFDHEQKPMRKLYTDVQEYRDRIKLVHERVCNSFYQTENKSVLDSYPNWNIEDNIYQQGDFVVNFCGRDKDERIAVMKNFIK